MRKRCYNVNHMNYKNYGARGIIMCDAWYKSFPQFASDMGNKPTTDHTIDRINNDGIYEPSNCRWATMTQQHANSRARSNALTIEQRRLRDRAIEKIKRQQGSINLSDRHIKIILKKEGKKLMDITIEMIDGRRSQIQAHRSKRNKT